MEKFFAIIFRNALAIWWVEVIEVIEATVCRSCREGKGVDYNVLDRERRHVSRLCTCHKLHWRASVCHSPCRYSSGSEDVKGFLLRVGQWTHCNPALSCKCDGHNGLELSIRASNNRNNKLDSLVWAYGFEEGFVV